MGRDGGHERGVPDASQPRSQQPLEPCPSGTSALLLVQGRIGEVERWIEDRRLTAEDEVSYMREPDHVLLVRMLLARSDPERALGLLQRLDDLAESQDRKQSLIQIKALLSLALGMSGCLPTKGRLWPDSSRASSVRVSRIASG